MFQMFIYYKKNKYSSTILFFELPQTFNQVNVKRNLSTDFIIEFGDDDPDFQRDANQSWAKTIT